MSSGIRSLLLFIYGVNRLQDLRFTKIYIAAHKIYGPLRTPRSHPRPFWKMGSICFQKKSIVWREPHIRICTRYYMSPKA